MKSNPKSNPLTHLLHRPFWHLLKTSIFRLFTPLLLVLVLASSALANVVFLVRTGTDARGKPLFRTADSRDSYLSSVHSRVQSSRAIQAVSQYQDAVQRDKYAQELSGRGYSKEQVQQALSQYRPDPVYIEINGDSSGFYNDWKGSFSVQTPSGYTYSIQSPRVVMPLNSQVVKSGNWGLIEQTIVHEIGHGVHSHSCGHNNLPSSPYLSKPHAGGDATDEALAFIEGYAEFIGSYFTGRLTIAEDPDNALATNWYAKDLRTGRFKPVSTLVRTEGWVATTLYKIAQNGKSQDAMWKMTRVMAHVKPQSVTELLSATQRYYPELGPVIQKTLYETTGGQAGNPTGGTYAQRVGQGQGNYGQSTGQSTGQRTGQRTVTGYGQQGASQQGSADPYDQFYYSLVGSRGTNISAAYQQLIQYQNAVATQGGDINTLRRVGRGSQVLYSLYGYLQQRLARVSYSDHNQRYQLQQGMTLIANLYSRQNALEQQLVSRMRYAAQPQTTSTPGAGYHQAPAAASSTGEAPAIGSTYQDLTGSMQPGATDQASEMLKKYEQIFKARQAARSGAAPRPEPARP